MRRSDRMIADKARVEDLLRSARVCRIAFSGNPLPYVVPLSFAYREGTLYFHSALEGEKIDRLRADANVCIEVDEELGGRESDSACGWGTRYRSVIARGRAEILEDPQDKSAALELLMLKYSGRSGWQIPAASLPRVAVVAVVLSDISGKESP